MLELKDYIIIFIILAIIYQIYMKKECFTTTTSSTLSDPLKIKELINDIYRVDMTNMRNLGDICTKFKKLSIGENNIADMKGTIDNIDVNILNVNDKINVQNLIVDGNIIYNNKDNDTYDPNLFPRYMILTWGTDNYIPKGWVICDGSTWYVDPVTKNYMKTNVEGYIMVSTPDLRGRFLKGSGKMPNMGGEEMTKLELTHLPNHIHGGVMFIFYRNTTDNINKNIFKNELNDITLNEPVNVLYPEKYNKAKYYVGHDAMNGNESMMLTNHQNYYYEQSNLTGGTSKLKPNYSTTALPHNNMPPFYTLIYIMKL